MTTSPERLLATKRLETVSVIVVVMVPPAVRSDFSLPSDLKPQVLRCCLSEQVVRSDFSLPSDLKRSSGPASYAPASSSVRSDFSLPSDLKLYRSTLPNLLEGVRSDFSLPSNLKPVEQVVLADARGSGATSRYQAT